MTAIRLAALLILGAATPAIADPMPGMPGMATTGPSGAEVDRAMMGGMDAMTKAMAEAPMTGDADRDFAAMMKPHHKGAIDMARAELQYGHDPEMRRLARDIVAAQEKEIALMSRWQAKHPAP